VNNRTLNLMLLAGIAVAVSWIVVLKLRQPSDEEMQKLMKLAYLGQHIEPERSMMALDQLYRFGGPGIKKALQFLQNATAYKVTFVDHNLTLQQMANRFLLDSARRWQLEPPPAALEIDGRQAEKGYPDKAAWIELQRQWGKWYSDNRHKF